MEGNYFITITGLNHYYDKKPFEVGRILKIVKEPENEYDQEAICAELPYIGTVGYVANSPGTVFRGTVSSGRLYDSIGDYAYAQVCFITHSSVIALVLSPDEVGENLKEEEIQEMVEKLKKMK
ncbi:HIRAN domain-containing protein [Clostridium sp. MT-14]|uniref:HIRAN domain-containing protein n=1 Tax=Clostridium sp. MT-14 TaxID=3348360 RepID=UPI0035F2F0DB